MDAWPARAHSTSNFNRTRTNARRIQSSRRGFWHANQHPDYEGLHREKRKLKLSSFSTRDVLRSATAMHMHQSRATGELSRRLLYPLLFMDCSRWSFHLCWYSGQIQTFTRSWIFSSCRAKRAHHCFQCMFAIFNQQQNGTNNRHKTPTQNCWISNNNAINRPLILLFHCLLYSCLCQPV